MRVLFFVSSLGRGHVARCRPLVAELQRRGHTVSAAMLGRRAAALLADLCPVELPTADRRARMPRPSPPPLAYTLVWDLDMSLAYFQPRLREATAACAETARDAIASARPDVVVADQLPAFALTARALGRPVCQVTHGPLFPGRGDAPWPHWLDARPPELRYPPGVEALAAGLADAGVAEPADADELLAGEAIVAPTPPELGTGAGALHVDVRDELPRSAPAPRFRRAAGRPLVAISPGPSLTPLLPELVRGVQLAGADAVVLAAAGGGPVDGAELHGPLETASAFAQVDAVLHQGGSGTAAACLRSGVPSVTVPTYTEQEFNGRALAAARAGVVVPMRETPLEPVDVAADVATLGHRTPERLAGRIAAALSGVLEAERPEPRMLPGVDAAADAVEALVR